MPILGQQASWLAVVFFADILWAQDMPACMCIAIWAIAQLRCRRSKSTYAQVVYEVYTASAHASYKISIWMPLSLKLPLHPAK